MLLDFQCGWGKSHRTLLLDKELKAIADKKKKKQVLRKGAIVFPRIPNDQP